MINPKSKHDVWFRRKATSVHYLNTSFSGAGVTLQVLLHAFIDSNTIWFSTIYGDYNDNILLLGLTESETRSMNKEKHISQDPFIEAMSSLFKEYHLTSEIMKGLGVDLDSVNNSYSLRESHRVKYQIYIHDNCFFKITPVDKIMLEKLVNVILRLHSFYFGSDINWLSVTSAIVEQLQEAAKPILIKSEPSRHCLILRKDNSFSSFIKSLLSPRSSCFALIKDDRAILTPR